MASWLAAVLGITISLPGTSMPFLPSDCKSLFAAHLRKCATLEYLSPSTMSLMSLSISLLTRTYTPLVNFIFMGIASLVVLVRMLLRISTLRLVLLFCFFLRGLFLLLSIVVVVVLVLV